MANKIKPDIPKKLLKTKYRREMWENAKKIIRKVEKTIPISEAYVMGSFTTKKKRPADVDFIILLKTPEKKKNIKWSVDLVISPDNQYGENVLRDADNWVMEKYGAKKSMVIRLK